MAGSSPSSRCASGATPHRDDADGDAWSRWFEAVSRPAVGAALADLYERLDRDVASRSPVCRLSGRCCRFESYGHRLYVTALEIAWLVRRLDAAAQRRLSEAPLPRLDGCPFQVNGLCGVHGLRPMGCRVYFCDPTAQAWQHGLYEKFLVELRRLHERFGIAYRYVEWRQGLMRAREVASPTAPAGRPAP